MSLYYDAASILTDSNHRGSLKSRIYAKDANLKAKPAHVYALIAEAAKYDTLLKEVIDNAGILAQEPKLTPILALLLIHDNFFARGGIAAGVSHPLRQAVERHKARLQSELTKARIKRRIPTIEQLKASILKDKGITGRAHPRWARVNTLKVQLKAEILQQFPGYQEVATVGEVIGADKHVKVFHSDKHVPNLLAFPPDIDLTKHSAYLNGEVILQDKASCFPAHLLVGTNTTDNIVGDAIDGCAAPGNKTTHLAAVVFGTGAKVYACERDATRSKTLQMMVDKAGAKKKVTVLAKQDFLALDPYDERFKDVTHLLLDPSCSGSGILGREDVPALTLPNDTRKIGTPQQSGGESKKRKRGDARENQSTKPKGDVNTEAEDLDPEAEQLPIEATKARLEKLSNLQSRIVEHAFLFPAAVRVTYSTCSIHIEENEAVVARVLSSRAGQSGQWRVLRRKEQVHGMQIWEHRGVEGSHGLSEEQREACIRCTPDDGEGTMGFFVCGFVRDTSDHDESASAHGQENVANGEADEWEGFGDT